MTQSINKSGKLNISLILNIFYVYELIMNHALTQSLTQSEKLNFIVNLNIFYDYDMTNPKMYTLNVIHALILRN